MLLRVHGGRPHLCRRSLPAPLREQHARTHRSPKTSNNFRSQFAHLNVPTYPAGRATGRFFPKQATSDVRTRQHHTTLHHTTPHHHPSPPPSPGQHRLHVKSPYKHLLHCRCHHHHHYHHHHRITSSSPLRLRPDGVPSTALGRPGKTAWPSARAWQTRRQGRHRRPRLSSRRRGWSGDRCSRTPLSRRGRRAR